MAIEGKNEPLCTLLITYTDFAEQKELTTAHTFSSTDPGHYPQRRRFVHSTSHSLHHEGGGTDARGGSLSDGEGHATTGWNTISGDRQRRRISTSTYSASVGNLGSTLVESEIFTPTPLRPVTMKQQWQQQPSSSSATSPPAVVVSPQRSPYVNTSTSGSATDSRSNSRQLNIQEVTISYSRPGEDSRSMHLSPLTASSITSTSTTFPTSGDLRLQYRLGVVPPSTGAKSTSASTTGIVDSQSRTTKFGVKRNAKAAGATEFSSSRKSTGANVIRLPTREATSASAKNGFNGPSHGSAPSSARKELPSQQKQHHIREESYESLEESITRRDASKSSKRVYQHCTSEVLTQRTFVTPSLPTTTTKAATNIRATPSPTLTSDRSASRDHIKSRNDGIHLHAKYDDDPGVGRRPIIITGQPQLLKPLPHPRPPATTTTTTFSSTEEVISIEERVSAPRRPDVRRNDIVTSRSENHAAPAALPPLLIEAKDSKVVVTSDERGEAGPLGDQQPLRFIDYDTYRSEVEQLQQKAVEQEHSPLRVELEEPVPLAPALVISPARRSPKSTRPSVPPPPRPNEPLLKYFSREDLEEREEQHHYHVGGKTLQKEVENISYARKEPPPLIVQTEMVETSEVEMTREYERAKEIPRDELARKLYQQLRPILDTKDRATQHRETPALVEKGTVPREVELTESGTKSNPTVYTGVEVVIQRDEVDESMVESHDEPAQPTKAPTSPRGDSSASRALTASKSVDLVDSGRKLLATLRRELLYDESVDLEIQRRRLLTARPTADIPEEDEEEEETSEGKGSSEEREQILRSLKEEEELLRRKQAELDAQLLAQLQHEEQTRLRAKQREEEEARGQAIEMVSKAVKERKQEGGEEIEQSEIDPESQERFEYEARIVREGRRPVPQFTQQPTTPSVADQYQQHQSSRTFTSTAELKLLELPSSPQHHRMEQTSSDYRSTISSRHGYARPHHTLSPTPTGHRVLKMVSETSSLSGSGLSPYGGSTAASTIRDAREREKKEMSDLNDRLASYIEKVRFLEAQNRKLAVDLDFLRGRWGRDTGNVRDMYEADLKQARKLIDDTNQQRADMEKQIKVLRDEIAAMKKKHDEALKARHADKDTIDDLLTRLSALEAEINLLKRRIAVLEDNISAKKRENQLLVNELQRARNDLDQETLNRIDYQNQVQTLLEEIDFLRRAHDAEIHDLQAMACRDPTGENREYFRNELASAIREIRGEYDQLCQTQRVDMESWYKLKVQEIQTQSARQNIEQSYAKEEVKRLRLQLGDLRGKLADLESRNSLLEKQAEELNYQLEDDQRSYESALNERDAQIRKMRDECQTLMVELQMLLDTKQTLDAEIAIYRKMLEGEEDRAGLRQLVEQVVKTHHHKQVDEAESMRVLRGETASRSSYQRSAKGNVCIWEAAPDGKYVTLENTHRSKEENIGDWKLKRKIDGRREIVFTFPRDYILKPSKTVKVWARGQGVDNPPEQIVFDGEDSFGVGNNVQTILYNTQGEAAVTVRPESPFESTSYQPATSPISTIPQWCY